MQRRKHSIEFKQQVVQEAMETGNNAWVARKHNLSPKFVHKWVKTFQGHDRQKVGHHEVVLSGEVKQLEAEKWSTEKAIKWKRFRNRYLAWCTKKEEPSLTETLEVAHKWIEKGYAVRCVLRILGISPSTYYYQKKEEKIVSEGRRSSCMSEFHQRHQIWTPILNHFIVYWSTNVWSAVCFKHMPKLIKKSLHILSFTTTEGSILVFGSITKWILSTSTKRSVKNQRSSSMRRDFFLVSSEKRSKLPKERAILWNNALRIVRVQN